MTAAQMHLTVRHEPRHLLREPLAVAMMSRRVEPKRIVLRGEDSQSVHPMSLGMLAQ